MSKKVEINIAVKNALEEAGLIQLVKNVAAMPAEDRALVQFIIGLPADQRDMLKKVATPKGIKALQEKWNLIKMFV